LYQVSEIGFIDADEEKEAVRKHLAYIIESFLTDSPIDSDIHAFIIECCKMVKSKSNKERKFNLLTKNKKQNGN
jgi:hypothetical protein